MTTTALLTLIAADPESVLARLDARFTDVLVVESVHDLGDGDGLLVLSGETGTDLVAAALTRTWDAVYLDAACPPVAIAPEVLGVRGLGATDWLGRLPVVRLVATSEALAPVHGPVLNALAPLLAEEAHARGELERARNELDVERHAVLQERQLLEQDGNRDAWRDRVHHAQRKQRRAERDLARLRSSRTVRLQRALALLARRAPGGTPVVAALMAIALAVAAAASALLGVRGALAILTLLLLALSAVAIACCLLTITVLKESARDLHRLNRAIDRSRRSNDRAHRRSANAARDMAQAATEVRDRLVWIEAEVVALRAATSPPPPGTTAGLADGHVQA